MPTPAGRAIQRRKTAQVLSAAFRPKGPGAQGAIQVTLRGRVSGKLCVPHARLPKDPVIRLSVFRGVILITHRKTTAKPGAVTFSRRASKSAHRIHMATSHYPHRATQIISICRSGRLRERLV